MDLCGDETPWGHQGIGEVGSGVVARVVGKPGVSKGGQTVIVSDVNRCRPRAYMHRHKLHNRAAGFVEGPNEVRCMIEKLRAMIVGEWLLYPQDI